MENQKYIKRLEAKNNGLFVITMTLIFISMLLAVVLLGTFEKQLTKFKAETVKFKYQDIVRVKKLSIDAKFYDCGNTGILVAIKKLHNKTMYQIIFDECTGLILVQLQEWQYTNNLEKIKETK